MRKNSRAAFTLIELLVVVAIIAVLMAILLPSLGSVRRQAASVKCLSGLRSLSQGVQIFSNENDGRIPWLISPDWTTNGYPAGTKLVHWYKALTPYLTSERSNINPEDLSNAQVAKVMQACPSWQAKTAWPSIASIDAIYSKSGFGYNSRPLLRAISATGNTIEANSNWFGPFPLDGIGDTTTQTTGPMKLANLNPAGDRVLFGDSVDYHLHLSAPAGKWIWAPPTAAEPVSLYASGDPTRHGVQSKDGAGSWANYAFADGHAESLNPEKGRRAMLQMPR